MHVTFQTQSTVAPHQPDQLPCTCKPVRLVHSKEPTQKNDSLTNLNGLIKHFLETNILTTERMTFKNVFNYITSFQALDDTNLKSPDMCRFSLSILALNDLTNNSACIARSVLCIVMFHITYIYLSNDQHIMTF